MRKYLLALLILLTQAGFGQQKNYLYGVFTAKGKAASLASVDSIRKLRLKEINSLLNNLPDATRQQIIANADKQVGQPWGVLPWTVFNQFKENGNRVNYENLYFARRNRFTALLIGEITERKGRFMPEIINGLGLILEESTWALPAHMSYQKAGNGLPDVQDPSLDLFASQTANTLANVRFLLKDELNAYSPLLVKRIDHELSKRVFDVFLSRDDLWWMGFKGGRMNNWNTFINTNLLNTALLALDDQTIRNTAVDKTIRSLDRFLNDYPADGGCDEGPSYWAMAGGALGQYVDLLQSYSNGRLDFSKNELIHNIGSYVYKVHISQNYYVNFADASAMVRQDPLKIYLFGKLFNDSALLQFAAYVRHTNNSVGGYSLSDINSFIGSLTANAALDRTEPKAQLPQQSWFPNLQVLTLRQTAGQTNGLFFAAKGGNNAESHNHNDIGNFIIYKDGMPVVIDAGVGTYTQQTFSKNRYKLWFMQSGWHNCPAINGVDQQNGAQFKATDVRYSGSKLKQTLSMNIAAAYPPAAQVNRWQRSFSFMPSKGILSLNDAYNLKKVLSASQLNFLVYGTVTQAGNGKLKLSNPSGQSVVLSYDAATFDLKTEIRPIDDARLAGSWTTNLTRVTLTVKNQQLTGSHTVTFK